MKINPSFSAYQFKEAKTDSTTTLLTFKADTGEDIVLKTTNPDLYMPDEFSIREGTTKHFDTLIRTVNPDTPLPARKRASDRVGLADALCTALPKIDMPDKGWKSAWRSRLIRGIGAVTLKQTACENSGTTLLKLVRRNLLQEPKP